MEYSEFSGKTVDDAITEACQTLMVTSDKLDYEVVDKGFSGFLGIGTKLATIRARVKDDSDVKESRDPAEKKDVEKAAENIKAEFAHMSEDEVAYAMAGVEREDRNQTYPRLDNGQLRLDILDESIDRLYEGVRLWADIAEKSRRDYER